jgi:hypothetical protein
MNRSRDYLAMCSECMTSIRITIEKGKSIVKGYPMLCPVCYPYEDLEIGFLGFNKSFLASARKQLFDKKGDVTCQKIVKK